MSKSEVEAFIAHHGVKGMKWGVRRDHGHEGEAVKARHLGKLDKKWQKNVYSTQGAIALHNAVADKMNNGGLDSLNNKPEYKSAKALIDIKTGQPVGELGKTYIADYNKMANKFIHEAVAEVHGSSPSGNFVAAYDPKADRVRVSMTPGPHQLSRREARRINHADMTEWEDLEIEVDHDSAGRIVQASNVRGSLSQDDLATIAFFAHHGVKGMRWGVRRKRGSGGRVEPSGGTSHPKPHELSNEDLKAYIDRLQMEKQYKQLISGMDPQKKSQANAFIADLGKTLAKNTVTAAHAHVMKQVLDNASAKKKVAPTKA